MSESNFALSGSQVIPDDHLADVCKYRCGKACCKYIVFFDKFYCSKKDPELKSKIDAQTMIHANGDNCQGLPHETKQSDERSQ